MVPGMIVAEVPTPIADAAALIGALVVIFGAGAALAKLRPVRWIGRQLIGDPMTRWGHGVVNTAVEPIVERLDQTEKNHIGLSEALVTHMAREDEANEERKVADAERHKVEQAYRTEMRCAVGELQKQVAGIMPRVSALTANANAAYYEIDADAQLTYVNDKFLELYGMTEAEALQNTWREHVVPEDLARVEESGRLAMEHQREWICRFDVIRPGGERVEVSARGFPIVHDGVLHGFAGAMTLKGARRETDIQA